MNKIIFYGIRHKETKKTVGFSASSNSDGDCCCEVRYGLDPYSGDNIYLTADEENAINTLSENTGWFNAGSETPSWPHSQWDNNNFEVFSVVI